MNGVRALALLLAGVGCATMMDVKPYQGPSMRIQGSRAELVEAARQHAVEMGWTVVRASAQAGVVEALTPEEHQDGMATRHRWLFHVQDGEVGAQLVLEAKLDPAQTRWVSEDVVCSSYQYAREWEALESIAIRAQGYAVSMELVPSKGNPPGWP